MATKAILVDTVRCMGCRGCQVACKMWNDRGAEKTEFFGGPGYQNPADLSAETWCLVTYTEVERDGRFDWVFGKRQCMHCLEPACVSACPVGALERLDAGPVVYHREKCLGCRYCMLACPFEVPRFEYDSANPYITKCTMCADRVVAGEEPACVKSCPTQALMFGDRDAMVREAKRRIAASPSEYHHQIYGLEEAGGTGVLHLASVPFEQIGYIDGLPRTAVNRNTAVAMHSIPMVMLGVAALLVGSYKLRTRSLEQHPEPPSAERKE